MATSKPNEQKPTPRPSQESHIEINKRERQDTGDVFDNTRIEPIFRAPLPPDRPPTEGEDD